MAIAIRSPTHHGDMGEPDSAVVGNGTPAAVVIEVFVANHIFGNVALGNGVIFAKVALVTPGIEIVFAGERFDVSVERINTGEDTLLTGMEGVGRAAAGDFTFAIADVNDGGVAGFVDVDAVAAGAKNGESEIGCIDLHGLVLTHATNAQADRALGQTNLGHTIIEVEERETGLIAQTNRGRADV